jgi:hypothetical protein
MSRKGLKGGDAMRRASSLSRSLHHLTDAEGLNMARPVL